MPGRIRNGDTASVADDSYHQFKEDVELMKRLGFNAHRFSISWTRILPSGSLTPVSGPDENGDWEWDWSGVNQKGIAHYSTFIDELLAAGIEPMVTLYHWDLPLALEQKYGGWLNGEKITRDFLAFAEACFRAFGDRVKMWATINEPWTAAYMGYQLGVHAPGRCSNRTQCPAGGDSATESYMVAHNMLNAHAAVVNLYRRRYQQQPSAPEKGREGRPHRHRA